MTDEGEGRFTACSKRSKKKKKEIQLSRRDERFLGNKVVSPSAINKIFFHSVRNILRINNLLNR